MADTRTIFQGDSTGWYVSRAGASGLVSLAAGYTCRIRVPGTAVDRVVTTLAPDDQGNADRQFYAELTPAETALFALGTYVVVVQLATNAGDYSDEDHHVLTVEAQGIGGTTDPTPPTEADEIRAILVQIRAAITARINGTAIREAWRDGRRIIRETMSMTELLNLQQYYERKLEEAELAASGGRRRRAIPTRWAV